MGNSLWNNSYHAYYKLNEDAKYEVTNLAVAGDKIADQLTEWNYWIANTATAAEIAALDYVIIGVGGNDINNGPAGVGAIQTAYQGLVDQIQSDCNATIIASTLSPNKCATNMDATDDQEWDDFNAWMVGAFATGEPTVVIMTDNTDDLGDASDCLLEIYWDDEDDPDYTHVNALGGQLMYQNLKAAIDSN